MTDAERNKKKRQILDAIAGKKRVEASNVRSRKADEEERRRAIQKAFSIAKRKRKNKKGEM